jgi:hypothetical protein
MVFGVTGAAGMFGFIQCQGAARSAPGSGSIVRAGTVAERTD